MKAVVAAFNQEKALVGAFSVITNLRMEPFEALVLKLGLQRREVVVLHGDEARHEGAVVAVGGGVGGAGDGGQGPAPEVVLTKRCVKGSAQTCCPCSPWRR